MEPDELSQNMDANAAADANAAPDTETPPVHPVHALVIEAHAALKRGLEGFDRRGPGHQPNIDDVRLAFRALDAVLAEVQ